jgi:intracellular multiplication protein IcmM
MPRKTWDEIKRSKRFNVYEYRASVLLLLFSLGLNLLLCIFACYTFIKEPEPDYYATNGITPPVQLKVMLKPNESPKPLLESEPVIDETYRSIS